MTDDLREKVRAALAPYLGGSSRLNKATDAIMDLIGGGVVTDEKPLGAIENGRELMRRLVEHYDFECTGGPLKNCADFHALQTCFEVMADHITAALPHTRTVQQVEDDLLERLAVEAEGAGLTYFRPLHEQGEDPIWDGPNSAADWLRKRKGGA